MSIYPIIVVGLFRLTEPIKIAGTVIYDFLKIAETTKTGVTTGITLRHDNFDYGSEVSPPSSTHSIT